MRTHRFVIQGRLPSLNEYIAAERSGYHAANNMKKQCQAQIASAARCARLRRIKKPVYICYTFFEKNRRRDKDNVSATAHKFVQDALVQAGILAGDGWQHVTGFRDDFEVDSRNPRILVELIEE